MEPLASLGAVGSSLSNSLPTSSSPSSSEARDGPPSRAPGKLRPVELSRDRVDASENAARSKQGKSSTQAAPAESQQTPILASNQAGQGSNARATSTIGTGSASNQPQGIGNPSQAEPGLGGSSVGDGQAAAGALATQGGALTTDQAKSPEVQGAVGPPNRGVTYSVHPDLSVRFQGKVVDRDTSETIQSVPPEIQIEFMERYDEYIGSRLDVRG